MIWLRRLSPECQVPELGFDPDPLQIPNFPRLFRLFPGFATVEEVDAMGEGRRGVEFFTS